MFMYACALNYGVRSFKSHVVVAHYIKSPTSVAIQKSDCPTAQSRSKPAAVTRM